jgi:hypothetical protein
VTHQGVSSREETSIVNAIRSINSEVAIVYLGGHSHRQEVINCLLLILVNNLLFLMIDYGYCYEIINNIYFFLIDNDCSL